jgi:hypothetical protein
MARRLEARRSFLASPRSAATDDKGFKARDAEALAWALDRMLEVPELAEDVARGIGLVTRDAERRASAAEPPKSADEWMRGVGEKPPY